MRIPLVQAGQGLFSSDQAWSQALSRATRGPRTKRFRTLPLSPTRILALRLRAKNDEQKKRYSKLFLIGAGMRNDRLPVLTLQNLLAKQDLTSEPQLANAVAAIKSAEWKETIIMLESRGWSQKQLDHWTWILSADNGEARVHRFLSTDDPKPIFLLLILLQNNSAFHSAESLSALIHYVRKHHIQPLNDPSDSQNQGPIAAPRSVFTITQFQLLLRRLVTRARCLGPRFIVTIARLVEDFIRGIPTDPHHRRKGTVYSDQCHVFNTALRYFSLRAMDQPLKNMEFNWRAQKTLLARSDSLKKPLIINQQSYRSIRKVLIGLKKSTNERFVAMRYAASWPPYRQDFDGRDAKRTVEDDQSRSYRAGVLMKEAGYVANDYDRALDTLGGVSDGTPTIQTRSLPPGQSIGPDKGKRDVYSNWAMNVRATRNAQEAWRAFNRFAEKTKMPPNAQVYNEMFLKLLAEEVPEDASSEVLPGDSKENWPVHHGNYSAYELARLSPPSVAQLYAEMVHFGVKPEGIGLEQLVKKAGSVEDGLRYMRDSGVPSSVIKSITAFKEPSKQALRSLPLRLFNCYVHLLCRLQPKRQGHETISTKELYHIRHAIKIVTLRLKPHTTEGVTFRSPWYALLRTLARPQIAIRNGTEYQNNEELFALFLDTLESAHATVGHDAGFFQQLCIMIQKVASATLQARPNAEPAEGILVPSGQDIIHKLGAMFSQLTKPVGTAKNSSMSLLQPSSPLGPEHLHAYMRALAFLEAKDDMIALMTWMLTHHLYLEAEIDQIGVKGQAMLAKTLCVFHAFAGPRLEPDVSDRLNTHMEQLMLYGGIWRWPTHDEVDEYCARDLNKATKLLQRRTQLMSFANLLLSADDLHRQDMM
ncbi:hypothetical protein F5Y18DRAFT_290977 [Xylariaceae sp. FL1019]|nr:hypothetical protein F5Y18DRAFT_290977 [Xylariaceae sp. FL1019]